MNSEQDLLNKLLISKKIMEKHNTIGRGQTGGLPVSPMVEEFQPVNATYNLPDNLMEETKPKTYSTEVPTEDRIKNSKLPDEIKRLMIEHPIDKPTMGVNTGVGLSDELIEKAARLMGNNTIKEQVSQQPSVKQTVLPQTNDIKQIVKETVEEVLRENGLLVESESKSNDLFKFRVGQHIFEGRLTNVKKVVK
jgi:hypothetical protein